MSTTDQILLNELQYAALETPNNGASWPSGLWTVAELSGYLTQRQRRILYETGCVCNRATLTTTPNVFRQPLPADWIQTRRATWQNPSGVFTPLLRSNVWYLDYGLVSWESIDSPVPLVYMDDIVPTLQIQVAPAGLDGGVIQILYVANGAALANTGVLLTIPDDLVPILKWGVLADMFAKLGRGHDPDKAAYAETRFQLGIELVKSFLFGTPEGGGVA